MRAFVLWLHARYRRIHDAAVSALALRPSTSAISHSAGPLKAAFGGFRDGGVRLARRTYAGRKTYGSRKAKGRLKTCLFALCHLSFLKSRHLI